MAEYKTVVWSKGLFNEWVHVFIQIDGIGRELKRAFLVNKHMGDKFTFEKARWYGVSVCERYNRQVTPTR